MSVDRALLELAAKAAGINGHFIENHPEDGAPAYSCGIGSGAAIAPLWNSLTKDGDTFRLQVALGIELKGPSRSRSIGRVIRAWFPPDGNPDRSACDFVTVHINGDKLAAARRAVTMAAAEIARRVHGAPP
jgi:hypothetical protein